MGLFDILFGDNNNDAEDNRDWDRSVFDTDRFRKKVVEIGQTGKMSLWETTSQMDLSIHTLMKMASGNMQYQHYSPLYETI